MSASFSSLARAIAAAVPQPLVVETDRDGAIEHLHRSAVSASPRVGFGLAEGNTYGAILDAALASARHGAMEAIASALAGLPLSLPWHYSYAPRPGDADLAARIAFAELIGPDGPLAAPECRVGFTLMAPQTFYPLHAHPAVELYWVIAGHAEWTTPHSARIVPPGEFVLHPTNVPHAMRSFEEPLLALYSWQGDIDTPPYYL